VVTLGRGTRPGDVFNWSGETIEVNRGGRATYHGPSQIIFYPMISLDPRREQKVSLRIPRKDLHHYLRWLEDSLIATLQHFAISGEGRSRQMQVGETQSQEATGVWVQNKKLASIGIAVKKWITSHGVALNVSSDPLAFQGLNPCGFLSSQMTCMDDVLGRRVSRDEISSLWLQRFFELGYDSPESNR
jgi:lipoyl(octanoyl) transferase